MVLVGSRWRFPVACAIHRETDKQAERTWFFEDLIYGSFRGSEIKETPDFFTFNYIEL